VETCAPGKASHLNSEAQAELQETPTDDNNPAAGCAQLNLSVMAMYAATDRPP